MSAAITVSHTSPVSLLVQVSVRVAAVRCAVWPAMDALSSVLWMSILGGDISHLDLSMGCCLCDTGHERICSRRACILARTSANSSGVAKTSSR